MITLQISSDLRLAFSSRRKMFIMYLLTTPPGYRGGCTASNLTASETRVTATLSSTSGVLIRAMLDDVGRIEVFEGRDVSPALTSPKTPLNALSTYAPKPSPRAYGVTLRTRLTSSEMTSPTLRKKSWKITMLSSSRTSVRGIVFAPCVEEHDSRRNWSPTPPGR